MKTLIMNKILYAFLTACLLSTTACRTGDAHKPSSTVETKTELENSPTQGGMRVLSYNIFEGMKMDATKDKQLFVDWVKKRNPDVLAIQEANGFTQKKLEDLARSYGHPFAILVKEEGYPTAFTSKYPFEYAQRVLDKITHGFVHVKTNGYNFIVLHLNAHYEEKRRSEIAIILNTVTHSLEPNKWLIMGDFNSVSPLDDNYFKGSRDYTIHQSILDAGLLDIMKIKDPNSEFITSCPSIRFLTKPEKITRYDFIYISKDLREKVLDANIIKDEFTHNYSDHYPVMLDLTE